LTGGGLSSTADMDSAACCAGGGGPRSRRAHAPGPRSGAPVATLRSRCAPLLPAVLVLPPLLPELPLRCAPPPAPRGRKKTKGKPARGGQKRQFPTRRARYAHGFKRPRLCFLFLPPPPRLPPPRSPPRPSSTSTAAAELGFGQAQAPPAISRAPARPRRLARRD